MIGWTVVSRDYLRSLESLGETNAVALIDLLAKHRLDKFRLRADLARAEAMAKALDERLSGSRSHIAYLEAELAKLSKGAWRWRMSTTEGDTSATS